MRGCQVHPVLQQLGQWLDDSFTDVRVNSVGHVVVHLAGDPPLIVGVEDAGEHGVIADLHIPFLMHVPETPELFQLVAMNQNLAPLGHVRAIPEAEPGGTCALELRHRRPVDGLTQHELVQLGLRLDIIAKATRDVLYPAVGGIAVISEGG